MLDARATNDIEGPLYYSFVGEEMETVMRVHGVYIFIFELYCRFSAHPTYFMLYDFKFNFTKYQNVSYAYII